MAQYYEHKQSGKRFTVVSVDTERGTIRLRGAYAEIDEPNDPERFARYGYELREGDPETDSKATTETATDATPPPCLR